jgi:hypothetical protein
MSTFGFEVAHGYEIWKGYVTANSKADAKQKILNEEWDDIIDEYDKEEFTEGYEVLDIWE